MRNYKKHHAEHLDGSRGAWRPCLIASVYGTDGHPVAWKEIVVVSCHNCGLQYGVGGDHDGPQIQEDGTTDRPVTCWHCKTADHMTFEKHTESEGREHFAKMQADAREEVHNARIRHLHNVIKEQMQKELHEKALAEANKIIPKGANNPQELFRNGLKEYNQ